MKIAILQRGSDGWWLQRWHFLQSFPQLSTISALNLASGYGVMEHSYFQHGIERFSCIPRTLTSLAPYFYPFLRAHAA